MHIMTDRGWKRIGGEVAPSNRTHYPIPASWQTGSKHTSAQAYIAWCDAEIEGSQRARGVFKEAA